MEDPQSEIVSLYQSRSKKRCAEYALVLQAVGIRYEVLRRDSEFQLVVHVRDADRAQEQFRLYSHENQARPPTLIVASGFVTDSPARVSTV